jgi:glycosyltransferase involved in cell wall biosynthesis
MNVDFSIITPSYNMISHLRRCVRSVADQQGISVQHIVIDGGSTDGSLEWLAAQAGLEFVSERDNGMYDAINKGLARARGDIIAYLNCDEQYLEGTLSLVKDIFDRKPKLDILFGDVLLIDEHGRLIAYRKGYQARWFYILASHLYVLSCAMFFRRTIIDDGYRFDVRFRDAADAAFVVSLLKKPYRAEHVRQYLSTFCYTGNNMSLGMNARAEALKLRKSAPLWLRLLRPCIDTLRLLEKLFSGAYIQRFPIEYGVYVNDQGARARFKVLQGSFRWPKKKHY